MGLLCFKEVISVQKQNTYNGNKEEGFISLQIKITNYKTMEPNKKQMHRGLTKTDRQDLRNQCKMGLGLSILVFVLTTIVVMIVYKSYFDLNPNALNTKMVISISIGTLIFSIILNFLINRKYYQDLQFNEKIQVTKTLMSKCKTTDYIASSGKNMTKAYIEKFEFVVDDIKFNVDKELFECCTEGDKLIFNYALKSQYLLSIEKK